MPSIRPCVCSGAVSWFSELVPSRTLNGRTVDPTGEVDGVENRYVIEHRARCRAERPTVYRLLADTQGWPSWSPIRKATIEHPAGPDGTGEIRVFRTGPFATREEVLVNAPPNRYSYRLISGIPVRDYRSDIAITSRDEGCEVTWHSEFNPRWPGSGGINRAILSLFIRMMLRKLVQAAENH